MRHTELPAPPQGPRYRGNVGNLMQHWTLCEILTVAQRHTSGLSYVDAHAMAPMARRRNDECQTFDHVLNGKREESIYEQAWRRLALGGSEPGYPNSAALVQDLWKGRVDMLLCEKDPAAVAALRTWAHDRNGVTVAGGDWRDTFEKGLPNAPLTLVSFDPYMYNRNHRNRKPCNLYPFDLERTLRALVSAAGGVLIQLSTYDTNDNNPQERVISSIDGILASCRLRQAAVVRVNGKMMSLVYGRGIPWLSELKDLPQQFEEWLHRHR